MDLATEAQGWASRNTPEEVPARGRTVSTPASSTRHSQPALGTQPVSAAGAGSCSVAGSAAGSGAGDGAASGEAPSAASEATSASAP